MSWSRPCPSRPRRKGTAGIGPGTKSIGTSGVRSTAAPKEIELVLHPADGLDLAGGPPRLPAVPPRPYSARSPASQECRGNPGAPEYAPPPSPISQRHRPLPGGPDRLCRMHLHLVHHIVEIVDLADGDCCAVRLD